MCIYMFLKTILKLNLIRLFYLKLETNLFNAKLTSFVHRNTDGSASSFKSATDPVTTNLTFKIQMSYWLTCSCRGFNTKNLLFECMTTSSALIVFPFCFQQKDVVPLLTHIHSVIDF